MTLGIQSADEVRDTTEPRRSTASSPQSLRERLLSQPVVVAVVVVALLVIGRLSTPEFVTVSNFLTILRAASITGITALGMTFVTISGNYFSLSVSQTAVLGSVLYAAVASTAAGFLGGILVAVAVCAVVGLIQGAIVGVGGNPVVVSLAAGTAITGFVLVATSSSRVVLKAPADSLAVQLGRGEPLGIPTATWAFVLFAILSAVLLGRTSLGRRTYLVGANKRTAVATGLSVRGTITLAFTICALGACAAGILNAAEFGVADASQFTGLDVSAIAAVLVGGTAIKGGEGSVIRTITGTLFIAVLQNLLQLRGYDYGARLSFVGAAVVVAVSAYALMKRRAG